MKRLAFLLCWLLTGFSLQATAGNVLGADLTYSMIAPNIYVISFKMVKDCSATPPATSYNLQLSSSACAALTRTVALNQMGPATLVSDYCPANANACAPFTQPGIALIYHYGTTLSFSAAEIACSDWTMGVTIHDDTRSASANIVGTPPLYLEAFVKLGNNIHNSSVEFAPNNIPFKTAFLNLKTNYFLSAAETDGDSLVFSIRSASGAAGNPVTYKPAFTAQNPVVSNPASVFDASTGELQFSPNVFVPNTLPAQGANRYVAAFQIDEYRYLNGVPTRVGSMQRDMIFQIKEPDTAQKAPFFTNFTVNGQPWDTAQVLQIVIGQSVSVKFETNDLNPGDSLTYYNGPNSIPFANITVTDNFNKPKIEMVLTPALQHAWPQSLYFLPIVVEDDACPISARTIAWLKFEVIEVTGIPTAINKGSHFSAFPNPFNEVVNFSYEQTGKAGSIQIYTILGQLIDEISLEHQEPGKQQILWKNASSHAAGTYIARLISEDKTIQTLKFTKLQ